MIKNQPLIDRFLRYVKIDTQSDERTGTVPSTMKQHDLASLLAKELTEMGVPHVEYVKETCVVYAFLPGTGALSDAAPIGFIAHMDTSDAVSGANVAPRFLFSYDGTDALLSPAEFPELSAHIGADLIATDGTTLLGADDKAGVAEIMNMAEYFLAHPELAHRPVAIAFTPDEEIGQGVAHFEPEKFGAKQAYTVDGGAFGSVEYETFNAAHARVDFVGRSVHPGSAKGLMKNAALIAMEFNALLPASDRPEHTKGREGFFMLMEMNGECESASLGYIIRDHDAASFAGRKALMQRAAALLNEKYGDGTVTLTLRDQYSNMSPYLAKRPDLLRTAEEVIRSLGGTPVSEPVRGGTDGAVLTTDRGIPCPNLGTGGYNYHSRFEYADIREMELCAETLIGIAMHS